jgi:hypothetical protein
LSHEDEPSNSPVNERRELEINQIKNQFDIYHDQLNANREKFEKVYEESNLKFVNYRNIILTIVPTIIALLFTFQSSNIAKEFTIFHLTTGIAIVVAISFGIYLFFTIQKQKKSSEYLRIQKVFHDGYTTINFMKGLIHNLRYIDQLNENGLASLDTYFFIIRGGIVKRIRKKSTKILIYFYQKNKFMETVRENYIPHLLKVHLSYIKIIKISKRIY